MTLFRRVVWWFIEPIFRFLVRYVPVDDPWERMHRRVPLHFFGSGARRDFDWYFEGESTVLVRTIEDVKLWLSECEYASDLHLFQERDFWQHPRTFEHLRRGDCEDFALWAWRKLLELGYDADLVAGRKLNPDHEDRGVGQQGRHCWVMFRNEGTVYVYEPVLGSRSSAVQPLDHVRSRYIPEFGVGRDRKTFAFSGFLLSINKRQPAFEKRAS
jgi:hypothetical protein